MVIEDDQLSELLLEAELISKDKLKEVQESAVREKISLQEALLASDLISDENLGKLIADFLKFPFINLSKIAIKNEILKTIPEIVAKKQKIIPFKKDKEGLHLAMADPNNIQMREFVEKKVGLPVKVYFATEQDINSALCLYTKDVKKAFDDIILESVEKARCKTGGELGRIPEPPIIKIVDTILSYAYQNKASDIHIEPEEKFSLVRFRIDGVLHDIVELPPETHPQLVIRIKVMAKLRTDEHQAAQDGKFQFKSEKEDLDIRVSVVPVTDGEKVVMRLLSEQSRQFSLHDLGFSDNDLAKTQSAYQRPYGMVLATGPTGCGKTTTLYAFLKLLNKRDVNIMTIEDPVEYDVEGVNQIQVNPKTNLTFSAGLRSIVRQDPDIILVGEIRDEETAGIAINSAMTGHLVLSTLHTNDAPTAIPRLLDMGVEPFLLASSVNVIIAQRLVRKICEKCRASQEIKNEKLKMKNTNKKSKIEHNETMEQWNQGIFGGLSTDLIEKHFCDQETIRVYHGKGCPVCHETGYTGRVGIFEVLEINDEVREAIVNRKDAATIREIAVKNGMSTMVDDGLRKIKEGITTIEEVLRVTKE